MGQDYLDTPHVVSLFKNVHKALQHKRAGCHALEVAHTVQKASKLNNEPVPALAQIEATLHRMVLGGYVVRNNNHYQLTD